MTVVVVTVAALLLAAALLTLVRIVRGPSLLDRVVATDVLLAVIVAALGAEAALNRHATTLPILVVLAILGFVGSVSVVRFAVRPPDGPDTDARGGRETVGERP
ncbi:multisubunit sodium/proton antiporter, MrpF subunit [Micromonospora pattaloongensis]|uniref:Multisubunit sodium/proton antiporter, MrpF subunit n=1 Tax=Micromonospora pattaloongensis TaxID=405436 RepID=A0A1H3KGJ0_9ACTN|nr:monovalent cation/H+ antiporter complex subunit F [Micromonospora pattaloongensis]SDY50738.1 multisubunit sodium/proton antiporter, MrpF subunit [Micromonospora pattaloongensis]